MLIKEAIAIGMFKESVGKGALLGAGAGAIGGAIYLGKQGAKFAGRALQDPDDPELGLDPETKDAIKRVPPEHHDEVKKDVAKGTARVGAVGGAAVGAGGGAIAGKLVKDPSRKPQPA